MYPILFSIGSINFYTLGFLLAIGFFILIFFSWRRLRELGLNEEKVIDFLIIFSFFSFFLSRLGFIATHWDQFGFNPGRWLLIGRFPGLTYGGFLLGGLFSVWYWSKKNRWHFGQVVDEMIFGLLPFSVLFFLALFLDGSWKGMETSFFWGVFFPGGFVRRHPVALLATVSIFLVWLLVLWVEKNWRTWKWIGSQGEGFLSLVFIGLFSLTSFLLAFLEAGEVYYLWLKQAILLLFFFLTIFLLFWRSRPKDKKNIFARFKKDGKKEG